MKVRNHSEALYELPLRALRFAPSLSFNLYLRAYVSFRQPPEQSRPITIYMVLFLYPSPPAAPPIPEVSPLASAR